jgi:hypothetical protein
VTSAAEAARLKRGGSKSAGTELTFEGAASFSVESNSIRVSLTVEKKTELSPEKILVEVKGGSEKD